MAAAVQIANATGDVASVRADIVDPSASRTPGELARIVSTIASSGEWAEQVRLRLDRRWFQRLHCGSDYDVWLISWMPGQCTGFHDHGRSSGAFSVATGALEEHLPGGIARLVRAGECRAFGTGHPHDVRNVSAAPAISIHAYSPPLTEMNEYELEGTQLIPRSSFREREPEKSDDWQTQNKDTTGAGESAIEKMLAAARTRLRRLAPEEAYEAVKTQGAVLVDIRPESQRAAQGGIADALVIERNVLEWRLDPTSGWRLPIAAAHDLQVIVFCSEGYTSSLAASALQDLGLWRATDLAGGFQAWRDQGLPVIAPDSSSAKLLRLGDTKPASG